MRGKGFFLVSLVLGMLIVVACGKKADPRSLSYTSSSSFSASMVGSNGTHSSSYTGVSFSSMVTNNETKLCWAYVNSEVKIVKVEILRSALDDASAARGEKAAQFTVVKTFGKQELEVMEKSSKGLCYSDPDTKEGVLYTYKVSVCDDKNNCYTPGAITQIKH